MRHSKVLLIYFVGFVDIFACGMFSASLSLAARHFGAGPIGLGVFGSLYGVLQLFSSPICGELADLHGRKRVLIWCLVFSALGYLALGLSGTFLMLLLCRVPSGLFKHTQTLLKALLVTNVEAHRQTRVLGFYSASSAFGFVLAPTLGGYVFDTCGFFTLMCIVAAIFLFNMLVINCWVDEQKVETNESQADCKEDKRASGQRSPLQSLLEIVRFVGTLSMEARLVFLTKFAMSAAVILYRANLSVVLEAKFALNGAQLGAVVGYTALVGSVGGCFMDGLIKRVGGGSLHRVLLGAAICQLVSILLASLATDLHAFVLAQSPLTFCNLVSSVVLSKVLLDSVQDGKDDRSQNGLVFGTSQSVVGLARLVSPFVAGLLLAVHINAPGIAGACCAAVAVVCSVCLLRISRRRKHE